MQILKKRNSFESLTSSTNQSGIVNYNEWLDEYNRFPTSKRHQEVLFNNAADEVENTVNPYNMEMEHTYVETVEIVEETQEKIDTYTHYFAMILPCPRSGVVKSVHNIRPCVPWYFELKKFNNMCLRTYNIERQTTGAYTNFSRHSLTSKQLAELNRNDNPPFDICVSEGEFYAQQGDRIQVFCSFYYVPRTFGIEPFEEENMFITDNIHHKLGTMLTLYWME